MHIVNYSIPVNKYVNKKELDKHLHSLPHVPNAIPYVTSYYEKQWGFCISHNERKKLNSGRYKVVIESNFKKGILPVVESVIKGKSKKEIVFTSYICHPSMANDQLSGPITLLLLYQRLIKIKKPRFSYRFIFMPETIGSLCYLSKNYKNLKRDIIAGYTVSLTGGSGPIVYRKARDESSLTNIVIARVLKNKKSISENFNPSKGNDQRQFCSPGYNLPIGSLTNTQPNKTMEYHTSMDNIKNVKKENIIKIVDICVQVVKEFESLEIYKSLKPYGEPFLSKYNLYPTISKGSSINLMRNSTKAIMWLLNYSDGNNDVFEISKKSEVDLKTLRKAVKVCLKKKLLRKID